MYTNIYIYTRVYLLVNNCKLIYLYELKVILQYIILVVGGVTILYFKESKKTKEGEEFD